MINSTPFEIRGRYLEDIYLYLRTNLIAINSW